jgi:hypothetical protein
MKRHVNAMGNPHRNSIYVIEIRSNGKWEVTWNSEAYNSYDIAQQIMQDFEKYNRYPEKFRIVRYISEKPYDE